MSLIPLTVSEIREEAPGFKTLVFAERLLYDAGQYLTLVQAAPTGEVRRSYSIVSSPENEEPLSIGVKRVENGELSRKLVDSTRPGDVLYTSGAAGFFTLPEDAARYRQLFFLAAGSGITPILSLIKTALVRYPHLQLVLVYSLPSEQKAPYRQTLLQLEKRHPQLQIEWRFSNAKNLADARLNRESLLQLIERYHAPLAQRQFYLCGSEDYLRLCTYTLHEAGVPASGIRREFFFTAAVRRTPKPLPPDRSTRRVYIQTDEGRTGFDVQYPDTILHAARKAGLSLPYSCETGRCGSCALRCIEGKVWLSYNEVLTDDELVRGLTLTCTGHPVDGDVVLGGMDHGPRTTDHRPQSTDHRR